MLETIRNAWKIPDLRKKILFTVFMLIVFRFGSAIPVPWINSDAIGQWINQTDSTTLFGIMNLMSGGAFAHATIFAMGISPYINSSIIMQLLGVAIPALERMMKEGEEGRKKMASITRVVTIVLAIIQGYGYYMLLRSQNLLINPNWIRGIIIITTFTAGTAFIMWVGEQITEKGIGNGMSLLIFAGIVSRIPSMIQQLGTSFIEHDAGGAISSINWLAIIGIVVGVLLIVAFVVFVDNAERRIPVQYAKRVVGRKMYGGQSTHIPIKVSMAGVIPIIFAMSIMAFPGTLIQLFTGGNATGFWGGVNWFFSPKFPGYSIVYFLLIVGFTYFYTSITFNPIEVANNMKKNGGFIPGFRPGKPTSDYIAKVMSRITLAGAIFLGIIAVLPIVVGLFSTKLSNFGFSGSSLLIVVGVALETVKQIQSQMLMRHYKGFLE